MESGIPPPPPKVAAVNNDVVVDHHEDEHENELTRVPSGPPYSAFSPKSKMIIVALVSVSALISPFGATTFYPALNVFAKQLNVSPAMVNLSLTTYMVCGKPPHFQTFAHICRL